MVTKQEALAALARARTLLDEAEAASIIAEEYLDEQDEAGVEVDRSDWEHGDDFGVVRDRFNGIQHNVEQLT